MTTERRPRRAWVAAALTSTLLLAAAGAGRAAELPVALQLSYGTESDFGIGARLSLRLLPNRTGPAGRLWLVTSLEYYFPSEDEVLRDLNVDSSYFEINENLIYTLTTAKKGKLEPYVGAGINVARAAVSVEDFSESSTDLGLNVLAGAKLHREGAFMPFVEARREIGGGRQTILTVGVFF